MNTTLLRRGLAAIGLCAATTTALATPAWETGNYDPAVWTPSSGNVIAGISATDGLTYYNEPGKDMAQNLPGGSASAMLALTDGEVPGANVDYNKIVGISGGTLTWELPSAVNLTGFLIFTRWGDGGRDGIYTRSLAVRYAGDSGYTVLDAVPRADVGRNDNGSSGHLYASLTDPDALLAENITGIQLTFSGSQDNNGTGYVEIEAIGIPAAAAWHTISVGGITAWRATVSGTVGGCGGGTSSDIYFACGADASTLVPALALSDVAEGDSFTLPQLTGLAAETTYSYASYSVSDNGVQSPLVTGTFTTAAAIPVEASATLKYAGMSKAALEGVVSSLGEEGASATFYFAAGADAASLAPVAITNGLAADEAFEIALTGLESAATYAYAWYAVNDLGASSTTNTGSFTTSDGSSPRWLGLVSENWSDDLNWDTETAPEANSTVARIILDYPYGCHPPANLDIEGLAITRLRIASNRDYAFTMDGAPFTCWGIESEGSAAGDVTILNDIDARDGGWGNFSAGLQNRQKLRLLGTISSPVAELTIRNSEPGGSLYIGGTNSVQGRLECHVGSFSILSGDSLGVAPAERPANPDINENFGAFHLVNPGARGLELFRFDATRYIRGNITLHDGTEADVASALGDDIEFNGDGSAVKHVLLKGAALASAGAAYSGQARVQAGNGVLMGIAPGFTADPSRGFHSFNSTIDFAGNSFANFIQNYSYGAKEAPNYINSDRDTAIVLSGPVRLGYDFNVKFFGGPGDIRVEGDIAQDGSFHFHKNGQGRLTLAGEAAGWTGDTSFIGDTTLDYRTHNTPKLGNAAVTMAHGDLRIVANESESTACELSGLTLGGGLTTLSTETGAGLALALPRIGSINRDQAIDFQLDDGTSLVFTDAAFANNAQFGGLNASATWDHGSAFAWLDAGGVPGPLPDSSLDATLSNGTIWRIAGDTAVEAGWHTPVGLFVGGTSGDSVIDLAGSTLDIQSDGSACPILVSSSCGGDVTFTNGTIKPQNYNRGIVIHNWNTNGVVRISSLIPETNDNNLLLCGPGTTVLDNDGNGSYYGPHTFGGGTLRFTSIADSGAASALGKGRNGNGQINLGHGVTFEYVGTAPEGHSSNRRLSLFGDVTIKANGAGPLVLDNATAIGGGIYTARAILDGDGEGRIEGAVSPGVLGSVVKRGSGTWTIASDTSSYEYPTEVEEGTLVLDGALPSSVNVATGATFAMASGAVVKRHLSSSGTLRFDMGDGAGDFEPATVWGHAEINGEIALDGRPGPGVEVPLLYAENGLAANCTAVDPGVRLVQHGNLLSARYAAPGFFLFIH